MRYAIIIIRDKGAVRVPIGLANTMQGDLWLQHVSLGEGERTVPVLRCLNQRMQHERELIEPRMTSLTAGVIQFLGWERQEGAWYAQEWRCEIVEA